MTEQLQDNQAESTHCLSGIRRFGGYVVALLRGLRRGEVDANTAQRQAEARLRRAYARGRYAVIRGGEADHPTRTDLRPPLDQP